jgi:O-antigen ligase
MTEAMRTEPGVSGLSRVLSAWHDPAARILNIDLLTVLIAIMLPWSTSGVAIAVVLWLIALIPTIEWRALLRSLARPISALPIALFVLALLGTLWSDAAWGARLHAVGPTAKLLMLPLLFYHFERSSRGNWVFVAFLASCTLLLAVSLGVAFNPDLTLKPEAQARGIFVKNYIDQSQEFALCAVALAYPIMILLRTNRKRLAALLAAIALGFVANMMFVVVSRTALATLPFLLALFALLYLQCRTVIIALCVAAGLAAVVWNASPTLRATASKFVSDYQHTRIQNNPSGLGSRLEFWQKSLEFLAEAPVIGHGTGSTRGLFERSAIGETGVQAEIVSNPHNQTLHVAVQWGVIGIVVLYAMWLFHLLLFRGEGWLTWIGLLVVVQNILGSLFNSHLFDFVEGWMYVVGIGVAGGMTLAARQSRPGSAPLPRPSCWQALRRTTGSAAAAVSAMPRASKVLGGVALLAAFAFAILFSSNYFQARRVDSPLAREARSLMAALEVYRTARGTYPILPVESSPIIDLKRELAKGGYLGPESAGSSGVDEEARYVTINGKSYGLLFHVDRTDERPSGTLCVVKVGRSYIGWGERPPPACPF